MLVVSIDGQLRIVPSLIEKAAQAQCRVKFVANSPEDSTDQSAPRIRITEEALPAPFLVDLEHGIRVTERSSEAISRYLGVDEGTYLALCALLGLTQWRALKRNDDLQPEDFLHRTEYRCLFAHHEPGTHALLFENPAVCPGCVDFYRALGADTELLALLETVRYVQGAS